MTFDLSKHKLTFFFSIIIFVLTGTFFTVKLTQGYRIDFSRKVLKPTGILAVSSLPAGAQVFIEGKLKTATNNTLSLEPGAYQVEIRKPDFFAWQKKITIEKEMVTLVDAFLFPQVPDLKPLTLDGAENPKISPDGSKIVYSVPFSQETVLSDKAGLWTIELNDSLFNFGREPRQIAKSQKLLDFSKSNYFWSPDSRQILIEFKQPNERYLIDSNQFNQPLSLIDITASLLKIMENWQKETELRQQVKIKKLPEKMQSILLEKIGHFDFSPDDTKMVYVATASAEIPEKLIPLVLAASTQQESRKLEPNKVYVYDLKEDKNFLIPFDLPKTTPSAIKPKLKVKTLTPTPLLPLPTSYFPLPNWFPTSRHLYWINNDKVTVCEYDGTNTAAVYSGPFIKPFVFASPAANKLVVLANVKLDNESKTNLYFISLR